MRKVQREIPKNEGASSQDQFEAHLLNKIGGGVGEEASHLHLIMGRLLHGRSRRVKEVFILLVYIQRRFEFFDLRLDFQALLTALVQGKLYSDARTGTDGAHWHIFASELTDPISVL